MKEVLLEDNINLEPHGEDHEIYDPIASIVRNALTVSQALQDINSHWDILKENYPEYDDFTYKYESKHYGYGAYSAWYQLYGVKKESL